jgi:subtilisin family serine protease
VLIRAPKPYDALVRAIEAAGGTVTHQYRYVNAIAATVPDSALTTIRSMVGDSAVTKDAVLAAPSVAADRDGQPLLASDEAASADALDAAAIAGAAAAQPDGYLINNAGTNAIALHAQGITGAGIKVAVIDSGIRPGFPHITLDGSVIGGEDFVNDGRTFINFGNSGHGTFVAGMISANVIFTFGATSGLLAATKRYCGKSCVTGTGENQIPMIGSAPLSSIYALRVFGPTGGSPESRIIAAMDRVLALKDNYLQGMPETPNLNGSYNALNIGVCNMSLGGPTLHAGRDLEDELTKQFGEKDIVLVTSAGNAGPSGTTGGSPGTGMGSLTVGASSTAIHERILRDLQFGANVGGLYRPFAGTQMAYFSSRGPTADGRTKPDVVANGFASYGQGFASTTSGITIGSGTSFSAPTVAGVAALLRQAVPTATATQVRQALIQSANPAILQDGSGPFDRGMGHVDAAAALALLQSGGLSTSNGNGNVWNSVKKNLQDLVTIEKDYVVHRVDGLLPGGRHDIYYEAKKHTGDVTVAISDVTPGAVQNGLFGDDIFLRIHSAKTSAHGEGDYKVTAFTTGGSFVVPSPEEGLLRVTVSGDWTNASPIGTTVAISHGMRGEPKHSAKYWVREGDELEFNFTVPAGTARLDARLDWPHDWSAYPTSDVDLVLLGPGGTVNVAGATLAVPEVATIANPASGAWTALVIGFTGPAGGKDLAELRVALDGQVVGPKDRFVGPRVELMP